jgi:hypothetical protein
LPPKRSVQSSENRPPYRQGNRIKFVPFRPKLKARISLRESRHLNPKCSRPIWARCKLSAIPVPNTWV